MNNKQIIKALNTIASLNAYDSVYILKEAIEKSNLVNAKDTLKEDKNKLILNLWGTKSFKSLRGTVYPNGKTGVLRRTYSTVMVVEDDKLKIWGV